MKGVRMRKITLLIMYIFSVMAGISQISITSDEIVDEGDVILQANDTDPDPSILPGDAGANVSWDFSALGELSVDTSYFIDPSNTPFGSSFPEANLAMETSDTGFLYMVKNPDKMSWIGMFFKMESRAAQNIREKEWVRVDVVPEDIFAEFPIEFGNIIDESYYMMFEVSSSDPDIDSIRFKMDRVESGEIDAWGQLTLPLGTYNVLRSHISSLTYDSIWFKSAGVWTFAFASSDETETYNWWSDDPGTGFVIATLNLTGSGVVTSATYIKDEVIQNIHEYASAELALELYPNPVESHLNIKFEKDFDGQIKVMDLTGQIVKENQISGNQVILKMEDLPSGLYIYEVSKNKGLSMYAGKIVKR